jgi:hypothetical protein
MLVASHLCRGKAQDEAKISTLPPENRPSRRADKTLKASVAPLGSCGWRRGYAASVESRIGSRIEGSLFSGLLTRVELGHICIKSVASGHADRDTVSGCKANDQGDYSGGHCSAPPLPSRLASRRNSPV